MRSRARMLASLTFVLAGLALSEGRLIHAQTGPAGAASAPALTGGLERRVELPAEQLARESEAAMARMEMVATTIDRMYRKARDDDRDPTKALCLREKLVQAEVVLRSAKERKAQLDDALKSNDTGQANHDFQVLQGNHGRSTKLLAQAQWCVGAPEVSPHEGRTSAFVDPEIPEDQPGLPPGKNSLTGLPEMELLVPVCMSPPCN